ncbi:hypothetical protein [Marinicauda sp. Alg238-R41]|uniref:hypothetical protein n=1 Tax=Marinicauda sp. Alg238-R41 TaxID=2993447 RepID=UPI0022E12AA1|nr:hypothetical protein [Marinicauda sp. Alg238-R41]
MMGLRSWLKRRIEKCEHADLLDRYGGTQGCPWCRQTMQRYPDTRMVTFDGDPMLDEITCGNCGGSSLWRFEIGMVFVCVGEAPKPSAQSGFKPDPFIERVIASAQKHIADHPRQGRLDP